MFIISNMKVGIRLAAAFGIIVTLLIVIGVTSITRINSINTAIASIVDDRYVKVRLAFDVRDGVNDQIKYLRGMVIDTLHPEKNAKRFGQLEEATQRTNNAMKKIEAIQVTAVGKKKIAGLLASSLAFEKVKAELMALVQAGNFDAASTYVLQSMTATQNKFLQDAINFANSQDAQLRSEGQGIMDNGQ